MGPFVWKLVVWRTQPQFWQDVPPDEMPGKVSKDVSEGLLQRSSNHTVSDGALEAAEGEDGRGDLHDAERMVFAEIAHDAVKHSGTVLLSLPPTAEPSEENPGWQLLSA
jgi:hypothetical protein